MRLSIISQESKPKTPVLMGEFDPKNFMEKVPDVDPVGAAYPEWKKQLLARQLAEKALQESEEKKKVGNSFGFDTFYQTVILLQFDLFLQTIKEEMLQPIFNASEK